MKIFLVLIILSASYFQRSTINDKKEKIYLYTHSRTFEIKKDALDYIDNFCKIYHTDVDNGDNNDYFFSTKKINNKILLDYIDNFCKIYHTDVDNGDYFISTKKINNKILYEIIVDTTTSNITSWQKLDF